MRIYKWYIYEIYTTCFDQSDHSICNNYDLKIYIATYIQVQGLSAPTDLKYKKTNFLYKLLASIYSKSNRIILLCQKFRLLRCATVHGSIATDSDCIL